MVYDAGMLETMPRRPRADGPTTPITLRAPDEILDRIRQIADAEDRSLNSQIVRALREWLQISHPLPPKPRR